MTGITSIPVILFSSTTSNDPLTMTLSLIESNFSNYYSINNIFNCLVPI